MQIQTTSPEKFRVRPRCGVIAPNAETEVGIWLKSDQQLSNDSKDKFLIMATQSSSAECCNSEVAELWKEKTANDQDVENHRLVCRLTKSESQGDCSGGGAGGLAVKVSDVQNVVLFSNLELMLCVFL